MGTINKVLMYRAEAEGAKQETVEARQDLVQMENKYKTAFLWAMLFGIIAVFALLGNLYLLVGIL